MSEPFRILVNYPTRQRCGQFLKTLHLYRTMADDKVNTHIAVTVDADDNRRDAEGFSMADVRNKGLKWPDTHEPVEIRKHHKKGKIRAINFGVAESEWDICLLASDDMLPQVQGYDTRIREAFTQHFPNLDGGLWWHDGRQQIEGNPNYINTIQCLGRKEFERLGSNLYHPSYHSLFCDNEATEVGMRDGTLVRIDECIIKNFSPDHSNEPGTLKRDELYRLNNRFYPIDQRNYLRRKKLGFPL